jgi:hypothetical protein
MALDLVAELVRRAAADSGVAHALRFSPEALRAPLGLSQAHVQALKSAAAFPLPGASAQSATSQPAKPTTGVAGASSQAGALDIAVTGGGTLLPPEGTGRPPGPDTQLGGSPVRLGPSQSPQRRPSPAPGPSPGPSPASPQTGGTPGRGVPVPGIRQPGIRPPGIPIHHAPSPLHGARPGLAPTPPTRQTPGSTVAHEPGASPGESTGHGGSTTEFGAGEVLEQAFAAAAAQLADGCNCECCVSTLALVASVTATAQTAITAIAAIAQMRARS